MTKFAQIVGAAIALFGCYIAFGNITYLDQHDYFWTLFGIFIVSMATLLAGGIYLVYEAYVRMAAGPLLSIVLTLCAAILLLSLAAVFVAEQPYLESALARDIVSFELFVLGVLVWALRGRTPRLARPLLGR